MSAATGVPRPDIRGMNDSFGFLPQMQKAMERDAYSADDPKVFDVAEAEERAEAL